MYSKSLPFSQKQLEDILKIHPTPFYIYDEKGIRDNTRKFLKAFSWNKGFKEYYAVKANPNPFIIKILHTEGCGTDCSSFPELIISERLGISGEEILLTSNNTSAQDFIKANELWAIINFDDVSHIDFFEKHCGKMPEIVSFRYNPGKLYKGNCIIGSPEESKFGVTKEQVFEGFAKIKSKGIQRFGLHTFIASNVLDFAYFIAIADMMFNFAIELYEKLNIRLEFIDIGGGIGIPYKQEEQYIDFTIISNGIKQLYTKKIVPNNLHPLKIFMECGRMITGPYGYLISKVLHLKNTYKKYVGLDACMANLMRPGIYNAYHHITVVNKQDQPLEEVYDVTGSICENMDKFAINRKLPKMDVDDIVAIHDVGAHGHSMGFNYNGKLRCEELLLRENGDVVQIRRAETVDDYLATIDFKNLEHFKA